MNDIELREQAEKALLGIELAIRKFTDATSLHHVSRSTIAEDRNRLTGEVYEARQNLEHILEKSRSDIADAKREACANEQSQSGARCRCRDSDIEDRSHVMEG